MGGGILQYKISDLSSILDVSSNTIRRYENMGYIKPKRIGVNKYRVYSCFDIDRLVWTRMYRKYEFSHEEIYELINGSFNNLIQACERRISELDEQIEYLTSLRNRLSGNLRLMRNCGKDYYFNTVISVNMKYVLYIKNGMLLKEKERLESVHDFMYKCPEAQLICVFQKDSIINGDLNAGFGIGIKNEDMVKYDIKYNDYVETFPKRKCLSCILRVYEDFDNKSFNDIFDYINRNNFETDNNIFGIKTAMIMENDKMIQYIILFIPLLERT